MQLKWGLETRVAIEAGLLLPLAGVRVTNGCRESIRSTGNLRNRPCQLRISRSCFIPSDFAFLFFFSSSSSSSSFAPGYFQKEFIQFHHAASSNSFLGSSRDWFFFRSRQYLKCFVPRSAAVWFNHAVIPVFMESCSSFFASLFAGRGRPKKCTNGPCSTTVTIQISTTTWAHCFSVHTLYWRYPFLALEFIIDFVSYSNENIGDVSSRLSSFWTHAIFFLFFLR